MVLHHGYHGQLKHRKWSPVKTFAVQILTTVAFLGLLFYQILRTPCPHEPTDAQRKVGCESPKVEWHSGNPFRALYDREGECQQTKILPFVVGCPESCDAWRQGISDRDHEEEYYRVTVDWSLGQPRLQNATIPRVGSCYDSGCNYESVSEDFSNAFGSSSDHLETTMLQYDQSNRNHESIPLNVKRQARMHLSLLYLCCLTKEEAYLARSLLYKYIKQCHPVDIPVSFDRVECFRERGNSVTNIIVMDDASQGRLYQEYLRVTQMLTQNGVPVPVHRTDQMPFHVTLLGLNRGSGTDDWKNKHEDIISPILPTVYDTLQTINQKFWTLATPPHFVLSHDALISPKIVLHTRKGDPS